MSSLQTHIDGVVAELAKSPETALKELLGLTHLSIDLLALATQLRPVQKFGLLEGLLFTRSEVKFFQRMEKAEHQKQDIANYLLRSCGLQNMISEFRKGNPQEVNALFFESGSTIAHGLGIFANHLSKAQAEVIRSTKSASVKRVPNETPQLKVSVITNNFTGLTSLAGLIDDLKPIQGRLSLKYFGFFPFADDERKSDWKMEGKSYNSLAGDIERCDSVFATCSSFSFLAGPIVGSRANCITKRAMFSGASAWDENLIREFYLAFHFEKLVPIVDWYPECKFDAPELSCGCVFLQPKSELAEAIDEWCREVPGDDFSDDDRRGFSETWHGRYKSLTAQGNVGDSKIEIPIKTFAAKTKENRVRIEHHLDRPWLDWLGNSIGMHILIGLPRDNTEIALKCVKQEIVSANSIIARAGHKFGFKIREGNNALDDFVVDIEVGSCDGEGESD